MEEIFVTEENEVDEVKASKEKPIFYSTKDVAECFGCAMPTARQIFKRKDFPAIKVGKNYKVEKNAFEHWCSVRRCDD